MTDEQQTDSPPTLIMVTGPNGSGKSTLVLNQLSEILRVNPDEIAARIRRRNCSGNADLIAMNLADRRRQRLIISRISFLTESVFSHPSKLDLLAQAKSHGYLIWLIFVCLEDTLLNSRRVQQRAATGGHDVPVDKIFARYHRSIANGAAALSLADEAWFYDNSAYRKPHRLVARAKAGAVTVVANPAPNWLTTLLEIRRKTRQ